MAPLIRACVGVLLLLTFVGQSAPILANKESAALRLRGVEAAYNLDHPEALALCRQAIAADPRDAAAYRLLALMTWLNIVFLRGSVIVDEYLGSVTKPNVSLKPPPPESAQVFKENVARALALTDEGLRQRPSDPNLHYDAGAAVGLMASYTATVEGRIIGAFRSARRAYDEHELVLQLDPRRKDAGLVVGTYRYLVSTLSLPMRVAAYVAGFGGDRARGLQMIEEAARYSGENRTEAQFALVLLYNRERRFDEALAILAGLSQRFPRNRILWLESGSTALRAEKFEDADRLLSEGIRKLDADERPRMFGEIALWHFKRGAARAGLKQYAAASEDLRRALASEGRDWVRGRAHAELGRIAAAQGDKTAAQREYEQAIRLAEAAEDRSGARRARGWLEQVK